MMQRFINAWHRERFPDATEFDQLNKLREELGELCDALADGSSTHACNMEMADVAIALMNLAGMLGCNLEAAIMTKMGENLGREWENRDGVYHHI